MEQLPEMANYQQRDIAMFQAYSISLVGINADGDRPKKRRSIKMSWLWFFEFNQETGGINARPINTDDMDQMDQMAYEHAMGDLNCDPDPIEQEREEIRRELRDEGANTGCDRFGTPTREL